MNSLLKSLLLLGMSFMTLSAVADRYIALWKEVENSRSKDLPQTTIKKIDQIITLSGQKGDGGQLMKALLMKYQLHQDISPDSAMAYIPTIEKYLSKEKSPVMSSLYHVALGALYKTLSDVEDKDAKSKSVNHFVQAMSNPAVLLSAKASDYVPFVIVGEDNRYFNDDVLNIVTKYTATALKTFNDENLRTDSITRDIFRREIMSYRRAGMQEAVLFSMLDSADVCMPYSKKETFYTDITRRFSNIDVCSEAYLRLAEMQADTVAYQTLLKAINAYPQSKIIGQLQNRLSLLQQPWLNVTLQRKQLIPSHQSKATIEGRNITQGSLVFYKTSYTAQSPMVLKNNQEAWKSQAKEIIKEIPFSLPKGKPAQWTKTEIDYNLKEPGVYLVQLKGMGISSPLQLLYVTSIHIMTIPLPDQTVRVVVSDAESGKPLSQAQVVLRSSDRNRTLYKTLTTDSRGELLIAQADQGQKTMFPVAQGDSYCPGLYLDKNHYTIYTPQEAQNLMQLYTDRAIYRSGQTVYVGGFVYEKHMDEVKTLTQRSVKIKLLDTNNKELSVQTIETDDYGSFKASFVLPEHCLNGTFSVLGDMGGHVRFKVEEYKRPTFSVTIEDVKQSYMPGDTVILRGIAKTYSGFPIANTPVAYTVKRSEAFWYYYHQAVVDLVRDTVFTDEKGRFQVPIILTIDTDVNPRFYQFGCDVRVTTENGETETASYSIYAGNRPATMSTTLPKRICKERFSSFMIKQQNAQGTEIAGNAKVLLYKDKQLISTQEWKMNVPLSVNLIKKLPSGKYQLLALPADRNDSLVVLRHDFIVFSLKDTEVDQQPLLVYATSSSFEEPVSVLVGSSLNDVYMHYDCFANDKLIKSEQIKLNHSATVLKYEYKEEYGDGLQAVFTFVKDGKVYSEAVTIKKPEPDKKLQLRWKTFRDRLHPGQQETWTLQVLRKNKPVEASILATMYDASLDKIYKQDRNFSLSFWRNVRQHRWTYPFLNTVHMNVQQRLKTVKAKTWEFSHFDEELLMFMSSIGHGMLLTSAAPMRNMRVKGLKTMEMMADAAVVTEEAAMSKQVAVQANEESKSEEDVSLTLRTDFSETAFFCSGLTTNEKGEAQLTFRLPQSLTQWNFRAVAHDKIMNYGQMDTTVIASKDFMVQVNMPRFLRVGDKSVIVAAIRNASEKIQEGTITFTLIDPTTMKTIFREDKSFDVNASEETDIAFDVQPSSQYPLLICRFVAKGSSFSDGEQYYLPVLEDLQEVTETYPLSLNQGGIQTIEIPDEATFRKTSSSHRKMMVEYTANPVWAAVEALPSVLRPISWNAHSLASSFYALTLAAREVQRHPAILALTERWRNSGNVDSVFLLLERNAELKQIVLNETPWAASADAERSRLENLSQLFDSVSLSYKRLSYLDRLLDLQSSSGAWSWYKGMPDNFQMTVDVAEMMARLYAVASSCLPEKMQKSMTGALSYMDNEMSKWIAECKKFEKKNKTRITIPHTILRYLYISALMNQPTNANMVYLLKRLETSVSHYDMYSKALATRVLSAYHRKNAAITTLQSLMEHTVYSAEMGRYFDTRRAPSFYESYRIPTQVATLEAIDNMGVYDKEKKEMQQWLLQSKRTQSWNNPRAAVDAIYYLFSMDKNRLDQFAQIPQITVVYPDESHREVVEATDMKESATLGYIFKSVPVNRQIPSKVIFSKPDNQVSFAAVYAKYTAPVSEVQEMSSGLSLQCTYEVQRGNAWQELSGATLLHKGDVLRVRYDLSASRDYDFVSLKVGKAACLEPQEVLSGYSWRSGCYREVDDVSLQYFFQQLSKGRHVLYETYNIDRTGDFSTSAPVVQCVYSPEFSARTGAKKISVK